MKLSGGGTTDSVNVAGTKGKLETYRTDVKSDSVFFQYRPALRTKPVVPQRRPIPLARAPLPKSIAGVVNIV